jgi:putative resolvase
MNGASSKARLHPDPGAAAAAQDRDRPGQMNTGQAGAALAAHGRRLAQLEAGTVAGDLARDMTGVLTSFCARRHGRQPAQEALRRAARNPGSSTPAAA